MTVKKKIDENELWKMIMMILPIVILMNAGDEISNDATTRVLYGGLFGAIGAIMGLFANYITKDNNRIVKILTTVGLLLMSGFIIFLLSSYSIPTDSELIERDWITQKIGGIEFDSPTKLELVSDEIPENAKWFYDEMKLYSDSNKDRLTVFYQLKIKLDTFKIEDGFYGTLEGFMEKMEVEADDLDFEIFESDEGILSAQFSFLLDQVHVNGYGFTYLKGKNLESIWLIPIERGFSEAFIDKFDLGIYPDE